MTTDFSALCAELTATLAERIDDKGDAGSCYVHAAHLLIRARAALADKPAAPAPTVMEITELSEEVEAAGLGQVDFARAVLARWGRQPAPPADGEVAGLVEWLQEEADDYDCIGCEDSAAKCNRAAELLQQMEDLAADAVAGLRYIEESCGRLYGVGWDRVYGKADRLKPAHALPQPEVGE